MCHVDESFLDIHLNKNETTNIPKSISTLKTRCRVWLLKVPYEYGTVSYSIVKRRVQGHMSLDLGHDHDIYH